MANNRQPVSKLIDSIHCIIAFGTQEGPDVPNKHEELKKHLVTVYHEYMQLQATFDETHYPDPPSVDTDDIRQQVSGHFPDFGLYPQVDFEDEADPEIVYGDEVDDLTDIIRDLMEIEWRMQHTSEADALWHFDLLMRMHTEQHLLNLLSRLKVHESLT